MLLKCGLSRERSYWKGLKQGDQITYHVKDRLAHISFSYASGIRND